MVVGALPHSGSVGLDTISPTRFHHQPPLSLPGLWRLMQLTATRSACEINGSSSLVRSPLESEARALTPSVGALYVKICRSTSTTPVASITAERHPRSRVDAEFDPRDL